MIDYDGAKLYMHALEMWNTKSLFIPDWKYITTMELDCSLLFAVPLYGLFHNIFVAFGISNLIMTFCYIAIIYAIFQRTGYKQYAFFAMNLVLTPYVSGMLEYFNMMFFNGSQYVIKVMIPLLFILLLVPGPEDRKKKGNLILIALYTLLLFITSLSSGIYVMFCGILPLILYMAVDFFISDSAKYGRYHLLLCFLSFAAFLSASIVGKIADISSRGNHMLLTKSENWELNLNAVFLGIFQVLNALASEDTAVLSVKGIIYLLKIFLTILLLVSCIIQILHLFKPTEEILIERFLCILFPWNLAIMIFADTRYSASNLTVEYRYYLIAIIPLMLLLPMLVSKWIEKLRPSYRPYASLLIVLMLFVLSAGGSRTVGERLEISQYVNDICDYINALEQETESVFFIPDFETPEMCRLLDNTRTYCGYTDNSLVVYDYYQSYIDRSSHGDKNLILVYDWETPDMYLPAYISSQYEKVGHVRWYDVYYSPCNLFDSISGFPTASESIDFFYSPGYNVNSNTGSINDNGELEVIGNGEESVSINELTAASGNYCIELVYEETNQLPPQSPIGIMELWNSSGVTASIELLSGQEHVILDNYTVNNETLSIHIKIYEGMSCRLKCLHFSRQ